MGVQLAAHEFRRMIAELSNPSLFKLELDFPGEEPAVSPDIPLIIDDPIARKLPRINVNTGSIVSVQNPESLRPIGIYIPESPPEELRTALRALMTAHATEPFARFVFLCDTFRPIPFLGRYKFVYEYLGSTPIEHAAERASLRYGITEIRSLVGAVCLWNRSA